MLSSRNNLHEIIFNAFYIHLHTTCTAYYRSYTISVWPEEKKQSCYSGVIFI